jgi:hypothetical protein
MQFWGNPIAGRNLVEKNLDFDYSAVGRIRRKLKMFRVVLIVQACW